MQCIEVSSLRRVKRLDRGKNALSLELGTLKCNDLGRFKPASVAPTFLVKVLVAEAFVAEVLVAEVFAQSPTPFAGP
jgi:hypothetical protein